jgi:phosphoribosylanthranilate isomerase
VRTLIKICGITNRADALCAAAAGAEAIGFVFAASPRRVTPEEVGKIVPHLPSHITTVGLFVNAGREEILEAVARSGVKSVQLHGEEAPELLEQLAEELPQAAEAAFCWPRLIRAFRLRDTGDLAQLRDYSRANAFLIDAWVEGKAGGTGKSADWNLARAAKNYGHPVILAGGLGPENVAAALASVRPYGVDVSSGVEISPGKKDPEKIKTFVQKVKNYEQG